VLLDHLSVTVFAQLVVRFTAVRVVERPRTESHVVQLRDERALAARTLDFPHCHLRAALGGRHPSEATQNRPREQRELGLARNLTNTGRYLDQLLVNYASSLKTVKSTIYELIAPVVLNTGRECCTTIRSNSGQKESVDTGCIVS
jgi:hypothetical protein